MRIDSSGNVGIGTDDPAAKLHVGAVSSLLGNLNPSTAIVSDTHASGSEETTLGIYQIATSVSSAVGLVAGVTSGASPYFAIKTRPTAGGDSVERMRINSSGTLIHKAAAIFNEDSNDADFRVESDNESHMLFVDAGNDRIGINESAPDSVLSVGGTTQILAGANNTGNIAAGVTADVIASVPRGFSYVNISQASTASGGLLLLLYTVTASTTIVSTISNQTGSGWSASVSGRALRVTNSTGSTTTFYASCMTLAWGTGN